MPPDLEDIELKVKTISKRNPAYTEIVQWVGDLLSETVKASDSEEFNLPELNVDQEDLRKACTQGRSFLNPEELALDWEKVSALYKRLVELVGKREDGRRQAEGLLKAIEEKRNGTPAVVKAALASNYEAIEASAKAFNIDAPVLALLLHLSLRPSLLLIAQAVLEHLDLSLWNHGHCPVCGSAPRLADLSGEGGKRRLHCSLCETAWSYPRLRCPFCENDNRKELSYLRAEKEEGLRVDLCGRCNNYLKTMDLREIAGPIILPLDDVATWHLDIIAGKNLEDKGKVLLRAT
ncbi:MAG: formate dehydrogenase accessory protein FdhE [Desulfobacteraceae bacterium]|nr:formate dehydrogenase accessory protein FdhE [Desulfobacteraceae bacterium]